MQRLIINLEELDKIKSLIQVITKAICIIYICHRNYVTGWEEKIIRINRIQIDIVKSCMYKLHL